jgi:hypothetical protein
MTVKTIEFPSQPLPDTSRAHSRTLWRDCPWDQLLSGEKDGIAFFDDFNSLPLAPTLTTQIGFGQYKGFATSGATITQIGVINSVALGGGYLDLHHNADADSASLAQAYPSYMLTGLTSNSAKLWFECRIACKSLLASRNSFFVGLGEVNLFTLATAVPFTADTAAFSNAGAVIGFYKLMAQTTAGQINTVYTDRATGFTTLGTGEALLPAAFGFVKLGMIYDPQNKDGNVVSFFANGVKLGTSLTATQLTATTNLKANALGLMIADVAGSSVSTDETYLDWWRCAQLLTNP